MQCEQIQGYLGQYAEGSLPGYKAAWVVQHLAGCAACTALADAARQEQRVKAAPALPERTDQEAAATTERTGEENQFEAVQRPVPAWLQWVTAALITVAAGGAVWLLLDHAPVTHALPKVGSLWGIYG